MMYTFFCISKRGSRACHIDNLPGHLAYKRFKIMAKSYKDVNEHDEWNFDFTELVEFGVLKHF